jgi:hypothetical protein
LHTAGIIVGATQEVALLGDLALGRSASALTTLERPFGGVHHSVKPRLHPRRHG